MIKSMPSTYRLALWFALAVCLSLVCTYQTKAQTVVPDYQVFITSDLSNTGGDPNILDPTSIFAGIQGNHQAGSPLLIIVATPTGSPTPSLSNVSLVSGTFDGLTFVSGLNSSHTLSSGDVYTALGLPGDASENVSNFTTFDTNHGIPVPSSWTLNVFAVSCALGTASCTTLNFDIHNFVGGTFISAATCSVQTATACPQTMDNFGSTPFTVSGAIVPEPASMLLFGTGLVAMGRMLRRRKSGNSVVA